MLKVLTEETVDSSTENLHNPVIVTRFDAKKWTVSLFKEKWTHLNDKANCKVIVRVRGGVV